MVLRSVPRPFDSGGGTPVREVEMGVVCSGDCGIRSAVCTGGVTSGDGGVTSLGDRGVTC